MERPTPKISMDWALEVMRKHGCIHLTAASAVLSVVLGILLFALPTLIDHTIGSGKSQWAGEASAAGPTQTAGPPGGSGDAVVYDFRIVHIYPHDPAAFTEGLIFENGFLFESTGLRGKSTLRKVDLQTGKVLKSFPLLDSYFGEGLTAWRDSLIQLTWRSGTGFVYDKESFAVKGSFSYDTEGWGLTHDGNSLIMSDGSSVLRFLDPETYLDTGQIRVRDGGETVSYLNELEYIEGEIFANIWHKDYIARISPATGEVLGWADLSGLRSALGPVQRVDVLNGIAYDDTHNRIFVTGKYWPKLFEIELVPRAR